MKIAVPFEDGQVFQHFGRSAQFKFYEAENGQLLRTEVIPTNGQGHGALAGFLVQHGADVVLCGGIGTGAQVALMQAGIQLFGGLSGTADAAVADYLAGKLVFDPDIHCTHHDHDEGRSCGSHCGATPITSGASMMQVPRLRLAKMASTTTSGCRSRTARPSGSGRIGISPRASAASAPDRLSQRTAATPSTSQRRVHIA